MFIVSYDISDDKLRTKFAKFLSKYGYRLQYSVFEIDQSERIMGVIIAEIQHRFERKFTTADTVIMFKLSEATTDKIIKFGYAKNMDDDILFM